MMNALTFKIHLLEPLLVTRPGDGDPNSANAFNYIPGSVWRGALIERYLRGKKADDDLAVEAVARRLFFEGAVRYLDAYPLTRTGQRMLPTPLSWYCDKDNEEEIYDFAVEVDTSLKQPQKFRDSFWYPAGDEVVLGEKTRQINIHTYRSQRSGQEKGTDSVFRYEALAAGQTFGAVIVADDPADLEMVGQWLSQSDFHIGGSHQAGYGRVEVKIDPNQQPYSWSGGSEDDEADEANPLIVTCLSDTLVRDKTGAYTNDLSAVLGVNHQKAYTQLRLVGGFNRKWGLPLPQTLAIQAGSVFVYKNEPALAQRLSELVISGVGERRAEGFGCLAVNLQRLPSFKKQLAADEEKPLSIELIGTNMEMAQRMSERILRARLDDKLAIALAKPGLQLQRPKPNNTQLARLRTVVRQLLSRASLQKTDLQGVINHLNNLKSTGAKQQFEKAKIEGQPLKNWLAARVEKPETIWQILDAHQTKGPEIGQQIQAHLTETLACEYTLRLINGLLHQASKGGE
jgi:CRISPR-associated protein Csx10